MSVAAVLNVCAINMHVWYNYNQHKQFMSILLLILRWPGRHCNIIWRTGSILYGRNTCHYVCHISTLTYVAVGLGGKGGGIVSESSVGAERVVSCTRSSSKVSLVHTLRLCTPC